MYMYIESLNWVKLLNIRKGMKRDECLTIARVTSGRTTWLELQESKYLFNDKLNYYEKHILGFTIYFFFIIFLLLLNAICRTVAPQEISVDGPWSSSSVHTKNCICIVHKKTYQTNLGIYSVKILMPQKFWDILL